MKEANPCILTINGGSSSIRFAAYEAGETPRRRLDGKIDRIGLSGTNLIVNDPAGKPQLPRRLAAANHRTAAGFLLDWLEAQPVFASIKAVGHRVVHGMKHSEPEQVSAKLLAELRRITPYAPDHLPREIGLIEAFRQRHPKLPQVACFDTAFHRGMPRVAKLLPVPRRYAAMGVERYGFHGLSYAYLVEALSRLDPAAARDRVILAHLGNGASLAAVRRGKSIDTSMGFTPTAGLVMSTRTGDLDPGLVYYLARTARMSATRFQRMVNHESGLLGVSGTSPDLRDLLAREAVTCGRRKPWRCFVIRRESGSAPSPPRSVDWTRSSSRGDRRERAAHPGTDLRRTRLSRHRAKPEAQREECTADFAGRRSRQGTGHAHRRGTHDREVRHPRPQARLNRLERDVKILVVDVGGSHVKCVATDHQRPVEFESGPKLTPARMVKKVLEVTKGWRFDAVSIGYPGVVRRGKIVREPRNLGSGWVGFNLQEALGRPVKTINDAAMQALGSYEGGKMLFLGLGTGLGSALIVGGVMAAMELGHLRYAEGRTYEDCLGEQGRQRLGNKKWRGMLEEVVEGFRMALLPDYIVLGGGNVAHLKRLPPHTRRGDNAYAFAGGFRLWDLASRDRI